MQEHFCWYQAKAFWVTCQSTQFSSTLYEVYVFIVTCQSVQSSYKSMFRAVACQIVQGRKLSEHSGSNMLEQC